MGTYNKSVINSNTAPVKQRLDAIYDYVGAVYGKSGNVKYDGNLTPEEKREVTAEFKELRPKGGKLKEKDIASYIILAREAYLLRLNRPSNQHGLCNDVSQFKASAFQNPQFGKGTFLSAPYDNCGLEVGALYLISGKELEIAAHPENWVFFIDGYGVTTYGDRPITPEEPTSLFTKIGETLQIPLYNAIPFNVTGLKTMEAAANDYGNSVEEYIAFVLLGRIVTQVRGGTIPIPEWPRLFADLVTGFSKIYSRSPEALRKSFFEIINNGQVPEGPQAELTFWYKLGQTDFIRTLELKESQLTGRLMTTAIKINRAEIQKHLGENPGRKEALYEAAPPHKALVEAVYSQKK